MTDPLNSEKPILVSVSRRTDIPAFYAEWFQNRLLNGIVDYQHPYTQQVYRLLLGPANVAGFIFWSKNFKPFLEVLEVVRDIGYPFYCLFTITGYGRRLEPYVPPVEECITTFSSLSEVTSPDQVILRYDPIVFSKHLTIEFHLKQLEMILSLLEGKANQCIISFVHVYKKILQKLESLDIDLSPDDQLKIDCALSMQELCLKHGFEIQACCCPDLTLFGIPPAKCISAAHLSRISPRFTTTVPRSPTRKGCNCDRCQDIGFYDTCPHGCVYCYANSNRIRVEKRFKQHRRDGNSLVQI